MSIMSMTGFGRAMVSPGNGSTWLVEIKTVNHRFLDQRVVLPPSHNGLDDRVRKLVSSRISRGRVETAIRFGKDGKSGVRLEVDLEQVREYQQCLQTLNRELGLDQISLADMLNRPTLIRETEELADIDGDWQILAQAVTEALDDCNRMRAYEGASLGKDFSARLSAFTTLVAAIEDEIPTVFRNRENELRERIEKLLTGFDLDPSRLAQECAVMADKADVTEELVRLQSHIKQFAHFLALDEPVGRRLDFLLQEFLREVNTLSSKISNADIAHIGVEMKNEIEKLREQVQNIE
jgi:uncharacterized protein (TIGR00255 family)